MEITDEQQFCVQIIIEKSFQTEEEAKNYYQVYVGKANEIYETEFNMDEAMSSVRLLDDGTRPEIIEYDGGPTKFKKAFDNGAQLNTEMCAQVEAVTKNDDRIRVHWLKMSLTSK